MVRLPRLQQGRRVDNVADLLRRAIAERQIKPGERFPSEREMASQLGVGRIVVREALRTLESTGLVRVKRGVNGGCFVQEFSPELVSRSFSNLLHRAPISLQDLLEVRLGLEGAILRVAIERATRADLKKIEENLAETRALLNKGSAPELKDRVHEFHTLLADATRNPLFGLLMQAVVNIIAQYMTALGYRSIVSRKTLQEHENIFKFIAERDLKNAHETMQKHITEDNRRLVRRAAKEKLTHIQYLPSL